MRRSGNAILVSGGSGSGEVLIHRLHDASNAVIVAGRRDALEKADAHPEATRASPPRRREDDLRAVVC